MEKCKTIIRNASPLRPYTKICNTILQDYRISLDASGFITRMLSLPQNWIFRKTWALENFKIGETKLRRIMKEAIEAGYCRIEQGRLAGGVFGPVIYSFTDVSGQFSDVEEEVSEEPVAVSPLVGFGGLQTKQRNKKNKETKTPLTPLAPTPVETPVHSFVMDENQQETFDLSEPPGTPELHMVNPSTVETKHTIKKKVKEKADHNTDPDFCAFWAEYPRKEGKAGAYKHWCKLKKEDHEIVPRLLLAAKAYAAAMRKRHKTKSDLMEFTKVAYNWFKDGIYEDYMQAVEPEEVEPVIVEDWFQEQARKKREREERVAAMCSESKRAKFVEFLVKVYSNVVDACNEKVIEYFHARKYWDIDALIPIDVKNEVRARIGQPPLATA